MVEAMYEVLYCPDMRLMNLFHVLEMYDLVPEDSIEFRYNPKLISLLKGFEDSDEVSEDHKKILRGTLFRFHITNDPSDLHVILTDQGESIGRHP